MTEATIAHIAAAHLSLIPTRTPTLFA
jgi:hypothetical protein